MDRRNNWLIPILVVVVFVLLACCVLAVVAAAVGWVADSATFGPMGGDCPGCPGGGPIGVRPWLGSALFIVLGLAALVILAAVVVAAVAWTRRSNRPEPVVTRDRPEPPKIEE